MPKFKNPTLQKLYKLLLKYPPYNNNGSKNNGSSLHESFWKGFNGVSFRQAVTPLSLGHAAWSAGKEYKQIKNNNNQPIKGELIMATTTKTTTKKETIKNEIMNAFIHDERTFIPQKDIVQFSKDYAKVSEKTTRAALKELETEGKINKVMQGNVITWASTTQPEVVIEKSLKNPVETKSIQERIEEVNTPIPTITGHEPAEKAVAKAHGTTELKKLLKEAVKTKAKPIAKKKTKMHRGTKRSKVKQLIIALVAAGTKTRKEIVKKCLEKYPTISSSTINTYLSDGKNEKYNPFKVQGLIIINKETKIVSFKKEK